MEKERKNIGFNVTSMILGILSLLCCCIKILPIICAILSIIFFILGRKKDGKGQGIVGLILSILAIIIVLISTTITSMVNSKTIMENIEFDNDKIPTIYSIVGERKVQEFSSKMDLNGKYKEIKYSEDIVSSSDINKYVQELKNQGYTVEYQTKNYVLLNMDSKEDNKIINIEIKNVDEEVTITYSKTKK